MIRLSYILLLVGSAMTSLSIPLNGAETTAREQAIMELWKMQGVEYFSNAIQVQLADAIAKGDSNEVQRAIDQGADVNFVGNEGMTPLFFAMLKERPEVFQFLLSHGAGANTLTRWVSTDGQTKMASVMELAAIWRESGYLRALLNHGGDPNKVVNDYDQTPIYLAIKHRAIENIKVLVEYHADLNHSDKMQSTPLTKAVTARMYEIALLLLQSGADPTIKDKWSYSAVDLVKKYGNRAVPRNSADEKAYDQFTAELKKRGLLEEAPRF